MSLLRYLDDAVPPVRGIKRLILLDEWDSQLDEGRKVEYGTKINQLGRSSTVVQIRHVATGFDMGTQT